MFDKTHAANAHAAALPDVTSAQSNKPELDKEPAWKSEFRQTLREVREKGFSAYAAEINEKKLEELRQKILASMGLSESDLDNMNPEQREQIEKMIALEIQQRLSAEDALEGTAKGANASADDLADQVRAAPNGLGTGVLLMQELDTNSRPQPEKDDLTG
ncbi:MAG: hypothetical protein JJ900_13160 [Rhodospirillales bacterium]|nr:hypothetical protein [Rhodospirillales bacterium]MBO6787795.1 hypothetical protein [Rhodospirillales bacterium]